MDYQNKLKRNYNTQNYYFFPSKTITSFYSLLGLPAVVASLRRSACTEERQ